MHAKRAVLLWGMLCAGLILSTSLRAQTAAPPADRESTDQESALFEWHDQAEPELLRSPWSYPHDDCYYTADPYRIHVGPRQLDQALRRGRTTERYRQNVFELRRKLRERLGYIYGDDHDPSRWALNAPPWGAPGDARSYGGRRWSPYLTRSPLRDLFGQGRELEYYRQQELYLRERLTLLSYRDLFDRGLDLFRVGSYGQAARAFAAAADKNHEDAAARVHAGQALMAVGMYEEAMRHVRRAFELQPLLMQLPMNLADDYDDRDDYAEHLAALRAHVKAHPQDHDAAILLAYQQFFSSEPQRSSEAMKRIKPLARTDPFAAKLLAAAAPIVPDAR